MTTAATCTTRDVPWSASFYRGEQYDSDLGLYYLRARYYNPNTGRFMSRDPEAGKAKDPRTLHKYLYAAGDPINASDPNGRAILFGQGAIDHDFILETLPTVIGVGCALEGLYAFNAEVANGVINWVTGKPLDYWPTPPWWLNTACAIPGVLTALSFLATAL